MFRLVLLMTRVIDKAIYLHGQHCPHLTYETRLYCLYRCRVMIAHDKTLSRHENIKKKFAKTSYLLTQVLASWQHILQPQKHSSLGLMRFFTTL